MIYSERNGEVWESDEISCAKKDQMEKFFFPRVGLKRRVVDDPNLGVENWDGSPDKEPAVEETGAAAKEYKGRGSRRRGPKSEDAWPVVAFCMQGRWVADGSLQSE